MLDFLFCYGSLKTGFLHNDKIRESGFYVGPAKTHPFYRMYACGTFPALVKEVDGIAIEGELWNVSKKVFQDLDPFEGVNIGLYRREIILLAEPRVLAHTYLFCRATKNLSECGPIWKGIDNATIHASE